jgi:hypothetical protein
MRNLFFGIWAGMGIAELVLGRAAMTPAFFWVWIAFGTLAGIAGWLEARYK